MNKLRKKLRGYVERGIISGFNYYSIRSLFDSIPTLVISNAHETNRYLDHVISDLEGEGFINERVKIRTRPKVGTARWAITHRIRDSDGNIFPDLKIWESGVLLKLETIPYYTLAEAGFSSEREKRLVGETGGYQIEITTVDWNHISQIANIFMERAYLERNKAWPDAYQVPCIIIYDSYGREVSPIPRYESAFFHRFFCKEQEASFVHRNIDDKNLSKLIEAEFKVQQCLANRELLRLT